LYSSKNRKPSFRILLKNVPGLKILNLRNNSKITDNGLYHLIGDRQLNEKPAKSAKQSRAGLKSVPGLKILYLYNNLKITDQFQTKFKEKGGKIINSHNYWNELEKIERKYICNESDFIYTLYE
jgi:hypothetical protein